MSPSTPNRATRGQTLATAATTTGHGSPAGSDVDGDHRHLQQRGRGPLRDHHHAPPPRFRRRRSTPRPTPAARTPSCLPLQRDRRAALRRTMTPAARPPTPRSRRATALVRDPRGGHLLHRHRRVRATSRSTRPTSCLFTGLNQSGRHHRDARGGERRQPDHRVQLQRQPYSGTGDEFGRVTKST